jgi:hypothetical protein
MTSTRIRAGTSHGSGMSVIGSLSLNQARRGDTAWTALPSCDRDCISSSQMCSPHSQRGPRSAGVGVRRAPSSVGPWCNALRMAQRTPMIAWWGVSMRIEAIVATRAKPSHHPGPPTQGSRLAGSPTGSSRPPDRRALRESRELSPWYLDMFQPLAGRPCGGAPSGYVVGWRDVGWSRPRSPSWSPG